MLSISQTLCMLAMQLGSLAVHNVTVFQRQVFVNNAGYPMIRSSTTKGEPSLLPLPDYCKYYYSCST